MSRSSWKLPYFLKRNNNHRNLLSKKQKLFYFLLNKTIRLHNGKIVKEMLVDESMLGFRSGEFIQTKVISYHPAHKQKNIKKQSEEKESKKRKKK